MSKHARKSSPVQLRMLTAAMATGTVVAAGAALIGDQSEPAAPASTATALAVLQVPTPNSLLTGSRGILTTAVTSFSGATSGGGGPLGPLDELVPTTPSGVGPTSSSSGPTTSSGGPTSSSATVPLALAGPEPGTRAAPAATAATASSARGVTRSVATAATVATPGSAAVATAATGGCCGDGGNGGNAQNPVGTAFGGDGGDAHSPGGVGGSGGTGTGAAGGADGDPGATG